MYEPEVKFVCEELCACRVCLATDVKLVILYPGLLAETYEQLTGIPVSPTDGLPRHLCTMCAALLKKSAAFRHKCRNTHDFLQRVRSRLQPMANVEITMPLIRKLDRKYLKIPHITTSTLTISVLGDIPDVYKSEIPVKQEIQIQLKEESEDNYDESPHCDTDEDPVEQTKKEPTLTTLEIAETETPASIAKNDPVSKLKTQQAILSEEDEKIKEYLIRSKTETYDSYQRLFYNHLLDKYFYKTKGSCYADEYDAFDSDAEKDTTNKPVDFERTVICQTENTADNAELNKNAFFNYIKEKYVSKTKTKKKTKIVDFTKVRVGQLKHDKKYKSKEELDEFAKTYNFDIIRMTISEQILDLERSRKKSSRYQNAIFKCEECFRGFRTETVYKNHFAVHDPTSGDHVCNVCRHRFSSSLKLNKHSQQHKMKYVCRECKKSISSVVRAREHHKMHSGDSYSYECQHCGATFSKYASRINHIRIQHGATTCDICYEGFQGTNGVLLHKAKAHKQAYQCSSCDVHFDNAHAMIRHIGSSPDGACDPNIRACAKCGEPCASVEQLDAHVARAHVGRPRPPRGRPVRSATAKRKKYNYGAPMTFRKCCTCPHSERGENGDTKPSVPTGLSCPCAGAGDACLCPSGSGRGCRLVDRSPGAEGGALPKRRRGHQGCCEERRLKKTAIMCEICANTFQSEISLRMHQLIHTGEKPFQCSECPKRFRLKLYLQMHMNTHTGDRPFKCSLCAKAFATQMGRYRHQLVHTKARPHSCEVCDKTFQTSTSLKMHVQTVHMKIPQPPRARTRKRKNECIDSE